MAGWSEERRQRHREAIYNWKPWTRSTGPRTRQGKRKAAQNSLKTGEHTAMSICTRKLASLIGIDLTEVLAKIPEADRTAAFDNAELDQEWKDFFLAIGTDTDLDLENEL